jgi:hypothetical protein
MLRSAFARLAAADAWTLMPRAEHTFCPAAVRPGVQLMWHGASVPGHFHAALIRDDTAFLHGIWSEVMLGINRSREDLDAVVGRRWLQCEAAAFLKKGPDCSPLGQLAKYANPGDWDVVAVHDVRESDAGQVVMTTGTLGLCAVLLEATGPRLIGVGYPPEAGITEDLHYGDTELALPDLDEDGVITLADALAGLAERRPPRRRKPRRPSPPRVDVRQEDAGTWHVRSDDVLRAWGVESGHDAEARVLELVTDAAPHLLTGLEFDSYAEAFLAYSEDSATAHELAQLIRAHPQR